MCILNPRPLSPFMSFGLPDTQIKREPSIPMTKEEIRTVVLSKLRLLEDSVCWDIGAGTGSLSIGMALGAVRGRVTAFEKKEEAVCLIEENRERFGCTNLSVVHGEAPEVLEGFPAPTHVVIGGSSGNLGEIVRVVLRRNFRARIVILCVTLQTLSEAVTVMEDFPAKEREVVQLQCARAKEVGAYQLMKAENPVYVITLQHEGGHILEEESDREHGKP